MLGQYIPDNFLGRNGRGEKAYFRSTDSIGYILPPQKNMAAAIHSDKGYHRRTTNGVKPFVVVKRGPGTFHREGNGSVHSAGIDIKISESFGKKPGNCALSGARWAVDGYNQSVRPFQRYLSAH